MADERRICFDRLLPQDLAQPRQIVRESGAGGDRLRAIIVFRKLWDNGSTLRIRFLGGTPAQQQIVRDHAPKWTDHANLKFVFSNDLDAELRIAFDANDGAWSYVGTDNRNIPQNEPTMNLGWQDEGVVLHEFGHAIGLAHEHQNPAGGIEWNEDVVIRELSGPPNNWTVEQIRHNVLNKYSADQIRGTAFDRESVMLYFFPDSWVRNGQGTRENNTLSAQDKAFIASAKAYPRAGGPADPQPVELPVIATAATQAAIGQPGEEDLFAFSAVETGRYLVETGGETDVIMTLFGPDSPAALIAEDDDSGVGHNSKITADLMPGRYFVQIRHFNKTGGTGRYSIKVSLQ
jgi:hypothetical protein